ncbi:alkaline phosphatase family protein [Streptomyces sp. NBC_00264]|uniref:alkaline phosphatase family protein n=1 Tax=unclassified Streptomyces TaxID=2593676 RepID=UPI002256A584|nr:MULTISPECIES: alkaline phosphatase family protein [unclassified Streptomyces]MCX5104787.1 alkaline phosphatase family protein [Streptomyces sp. NBC_00439]MCX5164164.1 alkaline phosphatase family protein [Streptomyces sp. NBC_00305]MCX5222688.1 alkaline phosphatase family protein [Streptomyces sp. NBC_00264]
MSLSRSARTVLAAATVAAVALPLATTAAHAQGSKAPAAAPYAGLPSGTKQAKTLVIGVDGATFDAFSRADVPNLRQLMAKGLTARSNLYADPMAPTVSGAGWSSIATGVWPDKHNVKDNNFTAPNYGEYPDYATRLETADPATSTLVVGTWSPIPQIVFGAKTDLRIAGGNDEGTTAKAADLLAHGNPDSTFVHLDEVDGAGHSGGSAGDAYLKALNTADGQIGRLLDAVTSRPTYAKEDWLVVVTADHGHTPTGGHGGNSPLERGTFVIAQGKGIRPGSVRDDVKITDIAPTVLRHEGVATDPAWNLDGTSLAEPKPDAFDALRPSLRTPVDETRLPADAKGWTNIAPDGWSIDNSKMPAGGVTEWRGWSFATDEFWTNAERGQGRETNVRARNVFAVADSDEWDDKAHGAGQFDSTLVSPAYELNGAAKATVSYATNYRVDGPQTGDVHVSYDGGAPQLVKSYRADSNTVEHLELAVPQGAKTARLSFRYTGTNSAFWTVDQVAFGQPTPPSELAVASLKAGTVLLGRPGSESAWKVTATGVVRTAQGRPVKGAKVTAELTAGGKVHKLTGTTKKDGSVRLRTTVPRGIAGATLTVTDVRYKHLAYYGELDPVRSLDLTRPTGHRG